jgi:hypothetical protein
MVIKLRTDLSPQELYNTLTRGHMTTNLNTTAQIDPDGHLHLVIEVPTPFPPGPVNIELTIKPLAPKVLDRAKLAALFECLADSPAFKDADGVTIQRRMRDEW